MDKPGDKGAIWHGYALWQGYNVATTDKEARATFVATYGRKPLLVHRNGGCVLVGPITQGEHDGKVARPESV